MNNLVSIIVPTFKNRGGLSEAVLSVLNQDYKSIEVIVVDDNQPNTEGRLQTEATMKEFADDKRVIYIKHPQNRNGAAARNTGIKASNGSYIAFLDDDDRYLPEKITKQVDYLEKHKEVDAVYCFLMHKGKRLGTTSCEGNATKELLMLETCMQTSTLMFRRDALLSINGFDEAFHRHQDYDLMLRYFHAGYKVGCLQEMLCEFGVNEGENILFGTKLEDMKSYFFSKFMPFIDEIDVKEPGFKKRVLAKHYAGVYLNHIKHRNFRMALKIFNGYFWKAPRTFTKVVTNSFILHIKGEV